MVDKMMRMAARGVDGTAKPLAIDYNEALKLSKADDYEKRLIYANGTEILPVNKSEQYGGKVTKNATSIALVATRTTSNAVSGVSTNAIDLTHVDSIEVDCDFTRTAIGPYFRVRYEQNGVQTNVMSTQSNLVRGILSLDVRNVVGMVKLIIEINNGTIEVTGTANIHSIKLVNERDAIQNKLQDIYTQQRQLINTLNISQALPVALYGDGTEYMAFKPYLNGVIAANTTIASKEATHLSMTAERNTTPNAMAGFVTEEPISLLNIDEISISYELTTTETSTGVYVEILNPITGEYVARVNRQVATTGKSVLKLNVREYVGRFKIRIVVESATIASNQNLKVYSLTARRLVGE